MKSTHLIMGVGFSQLAAMMATEIVVVSEKVRRGLVRGVDRARANAVPCGVDFDRFKPGDKDAARAAIGISHDKPMVLFLEPHQPDKRFDLATQALSLAKQEFPDLEILPLSGVEHSRVPLYLNACDVLVLTSRSEGSPVVTKEALACNLPVVATDVGDMREQLKGISGCAIVEAEPAAIARELIRILGAAGKCDGRAKRAQYDNIEVCNQLIEIY